MHFCLLGMLNTIGRIPKLIQTGFPFSLLGMLNTIGRIQNTKWNTCYARLLGMLNTIGRIQRFSMKCLRISFARYVKYNR